MLIKCLQVIADVLLIAFVTLCIVILCGGLSGCAELPCEPGLCTPEQWKAQDRDPFPAEPITYGSVFGPQPMPGKITVVK